MLKLLLLILLLLLDLINSFTFHSKPKILEIRAKTVLYGQVKFTFEDARRLARARGHDTIEEFLEYDCPGSYRVPKNPDEIYPQQFTSWEDFLGITYTFNEARERVTFMNIENEEDYNDRVKRGVDVRLPAIPHLKYKNTGWKGWEHFLSYSIEELQEQQLQQQQQQRKGEHGDDPNGDPREHFMYCHI